MIHTGYINCNILYTVPSPDANVTMTPSNGTIYEGTLLDLICTAKLNATLKIPASQYYVPIIVDTPVEYIAVWTNTQGKIVNTISNTTHPTSDVFESTLVFNPVDDLDSGEYTCEIRIVFENEFILDVVRNESINFTVDGKF